MGTPAKKPAKKKSVDVKIEARDTILYVRTKASTKAWYETQALNNHTTLVGVIEYIADQFIQGKVKFIEDESSKN